MDTLILGIDIGTTGTKCTFFNTAGSIVVSAYVEYPPISPAEGISEQDPEIWWQAVRDNLNTCFQSGKIKKEQVAVIGTSSTNSVTIVDKAGMPLHNAITLHDKRAGEQVPWLHERIDAQRMLEITGNRLAMGTFALPTLKWLQVHKPELFKEAACFLAPNGYIIQKLTGVFSMNQSRRDLSALSDITGNDWSPEIYHLANIPESILPRTYQDTDIVGTVSSRAAELTGLKEGTPVIAGVVDTVAATIGAGAVNPGDTAITIGSSGRLCIVGEKPSFDSRLLTTHSSVPGQYITIQSTDNAGISLKWFRNTFGKAIQVPEGGSVYREMDNLASAVSAFENRMLFLPYLTGEKSPLWDPKARGVFFNIDSNATPGYFIRSVLEGVAFSIRDCRDIVPGICKDFMPLGGGAATSSIWCQIFADVLNCPILQLGCTETETFGDMIIAAQAAGIQTVPFDFGKKAAETGKLFYPDPVAVDVYNEKFKLYKQLYIRVKDLFR